MDAPPPALDLSFLYVPQIGQSRILSRTEMEATPGAQVSPLMDYVRNAGVGDIYRVPGGTFVALSRFDWTPPWEETPTK